MKQLGGILKNSGYILLHYFVASAVAYLIYTAINFTLYKKTFLGLSDGNQWLMTLMYILTIVFIILFFKKNRTAFFNAFNKEFSNVILKTFYGLFFTTIFIALLYGLLFIFTDIQFSFKGENISVLISWFVMLYFAAMVEEVICRNLMLDILIYEKGFHPLAVLFTSSLLFSLLHLFNDNFSLIPFINIILVGIIFGTVYLKYKNIYLVTSIHFFWNYITGIVLGSHVSGISMPSIFTYQISAHKVISGGAFGIEGSIFLILLQLLLIILFIPFLQKLNHEYQQNKLRKEVVQQ